MSLFGSKLRSRTIVLLDVESGSVASALALLKPGELPKVFGEKRVEIPAGSSLSIATMMPKIERAAREALVHASEVAARLRGNEKVANLGTLGAASIFLSAPWGSPNLSEGKAEFLSPLQLSLGEETLGYTGLTPKFYTGADAAAFGARRLLPQGPRIVCVVRGETTELLLIGERGVEGYATMPAGFGTVARTLKIHGGLTDAEVGSAFALAMHKNAQSYEPLDAAARHFTEQFAAAAEPLMARGGVEGVYVIAPAPAGEWFAQALGSDDSLGGYFPEGSTVRAMRAHHLDPHVSSHGEDLHLMLAALFMDARGGGV